MTPLNMRLQVTFVTHTRPSGKVSLDKVDNKINAKIGKAVEKYYSTV